MTSSADAKVTLSKAPPTPRHRAIIISPSDNVVPVALDILLLSTMKIAYSFALITASASAFAPQQPAFVSTSSSALFAQSRQQFLAQTTAAAVATFVSIAQPANAAKYGGFGAGSPEVLDPTLAEIDQDVLKSSDVQKAISDIKAFQSTVRNMMTSLQSDPQANIKSTLVKEFDFAKLRATFNTYNTAFEEDTQRGTDRLIRVIMQDITELDLSAAQKQGIPRSEKRLTTMNGKLRKLDQAFDDLLAFVK